MFTTSGPRPFDAYQFKNSSGATACATVNLDAQACLGNNFLVVAAYLGAYDPANQCANYLADIGGSPNPTGTFSFNIPAGQMVTLVVTAANPSPTVCTTAYRFSILGVDCFDTCIQDNLVKRFLQINQTTGGYLFTDCGKNVVAQGTARRRLTYARRTIRARG